MSGMIKAVGGVGKNPALTSLIPERIYDIGKMHAWLLLIKDRMRPIKWFDKKKDGTDIEFSMIFTDADVDLAFQEFQVYVDEINKKYGTEYYAKHEVSADGTSGTQES